MIYKRCQHQKSRANHGERQRPTEQKTTQCHSNYTANYFLAGVAAFLETGTAEYTSY